MWKIEQTKEFRQNEKKNKGKKWSLPKRKNTVKILWTYNKSRISRSYAKNNNNIKPSGRIVDRYNGIVWWNEHIRINWTKRKEIIWCFQQEPCKTLCDGFFSFEWSCVWLIYCDYFVFFSVLHTYHFVYAFWCSCKNIWKIGANSL